MPLVPGAKLGPYEIVSVIGAGGMGEVYRARDPRLDRDVAIKILPLTERDDPPARSRLMDEARSASQLNHPHICVVYEVGEENRVAFIAMEYIAGPALTAVIPHDGLPEEQVIRYGTQIADALAHAHQRGIVHRDLKAANVVITPEGNTKLLDFGLSTRLPGQEIEAVTRSRAELSESAPFAGTLPYMAPEQLRGEPSDARTDIWALGILLYEMLTGHRPFTGRSGFELTSSILRDAPPASPGHISTGLSAVIRKCMAKDPASRYQNAAEIRSALETLASASSSISALRKGADKQRPWRRIIWFVGGVAALLAFLAAVNIDGIRERVARRFQAPAIHSLAVLPLSNLSGDPSQDFFSDGMTAELIGELSKIPQLRVVSLTSAMSYKGTHTPLPQIASKLKVDALLEGSVARSANHVRVALGLYEGPSDRKVWSETFERDMSNVLSLEDQLAHAVAVQIRLKMSSQAKRPANTDFQAFDLYLKGRYALDQGSADQLKLAFVYFRQAIEKDPHYAPYYVGLANTYARLPFYTDTRPDEAFPEAKDAAAKALQLDPALAGAHASMAYVMNYYDWNRDSAEQEFKRALELNPNDADVHHAYSRFLASLGRIDEARAQLIQAEQLDPLSLVIQSNEGMLFYFARQFDEALRQLQKVLEFDPKFPVPYWGIGMCYEQQKKFPEAIAQFQKGIELSGRGANGIGSLAHAFGLAGQIVEAQKTLAELKDRSKTRYVSSYQFAVIYLGLGQKDRALAALEDAYHERSTLLGYLKMDPRFDPLRSDPRFHELLDLIHLPK